MAQNPFLTPEQIGPGIERVARRLTELEGVLPAASQSDSTSHYACADGSDVATTQAALLHRTAVVCVAANVLAWSERLPLTRELILQMHEGIFTPVFGNGTLGYRSPPNRGEHCEDDGVEYPIMVLRGEQPELVARLGARSKQVAKRVRKTCEAFELAVPHALGDIDDAALTLAQLYVRLIRIHPFVDGNGRTAWAAMQFAAGRVGFPFVQSTPTLEARLALGDAIRNGNNIGRLVDHIKDAAWHQ